MSDPGWMQTALVQARLALGNTAPNPAVGAVIVRDGVMLGQGYTEPVGGPHAETQALAAAAALGHDVRGATLYVTLEPCCHHGRTPPCTDAILAAGIGRVVVGVVDPFPAVSGRGITQLRDAGVDVEVGVLAEACAELVVGFTRVVTGGLPEVGAKAAITLDGRIATASGESKWITGEAARAHGHSLRATHDAILVGIETALADDPRLTCRTADGRDPVPVVLDSRLRLPADARLLAGSCRALVFCAEDAPARELDADVVRVPRLDGGLDLVAVLSELGRRGHHRVLVEGGGRVHRSFVDRDLVDHFYLYLAPTLVPGGRPWLAGPALQKLADAPRYAAPSVTPLGDDILLHVRARAAAVG